MSDFMRASLIRAIRTVCQTAVATIGTAMVLSDVNWSMVISASLLAGLLSILTSIATGLPEVDALMDDDIEYEEFEDEIYDEEVEDYEH